DNYRLLSSGGAMGRGCGPLIIAREKLQMSDLLGKRIAIPGKLTTAYLLLKLYNPELSRNIIVMPFNKIMTSVVNGEADAGLIIHESRFTYKSYGLHSIIDLGQWWEGETGLPIPLGCIIIKKSISTYQCINDLLRESVLYAMNNRDKTMDYVKIHSTEMADEVINSHIDLYVNEYTVNYGEIGVKAIDTLFNRADSLNLI
ncbi:MAG: 1,4-dihydroxy-6-naphthoate synthase, partial [Nitrospirae bacterium]|nr:1,4-dihydroxy-6-naphthoate synthase [Nitrospirota bacterium]